MSIILFVGFLGVLLIIFFRKPIVNQLGKNNRLVLFLQNVKWFQNHWLSGTFLFIVNAILFFLTAFMLNMLMYFTIPFAHLLVMFTAVIISIIFWIIIHIAWQGTNRNRLKMGAVGSSFYIFLTVTFIYMYMTLKPAYPGDDVFMRAMGLTFAILVTIVAFFTCFVITGFSKNKENIGT